MPEIHPRRKYLILLRVYGAPGKIRTPDPQIRRQGLTVDNAGFFCKPGQNRPIAHQYVSGLAANQNPHPELTNPGRPAQESRMRGKSAKGSAHAGRADWPKRPAHPLNRPIAQLSERWRVVDDPLQGILQRKKGNPRKKNSGWTGRSFCRTREALLRCVREYCGQVDPAALEKLNALPEWHLDWDCTNLDVHGTARAQPGARSEPLVAKALEGSDADE